MNHDQYVFDQKAADAAVDWYPKNILHVEGPLAGRPFHLEPWQAEVERAVAGWKRPDGRRRYQRILVEVPRGNGKSSWGAARAIRHLDSAEKAPQVIGAATDKNAGGIIFSIAARMVRSTPRLLRKMDVLDSTKRIIRRDRSGLYHVISADAQTAHGFHPTLILFDELHAQPNRELYDVLGTSQGTIEDPLLIMFTTAGFDLKSVCREVHDHALRVKDNPELDTEFLPVIYAADAKDDYTDPKIWAKANPNLGVSVREEFIREQVERAKQTPAYMNSVLRLHFNVWTRSETRWMPADAWDACGGIVAEDELKGQECYGGLDLASTTDLAAFVLIFPPKGERKHYAVICRFWVPEENIAKRAKNDGVPYEDWVYDNYIKATPGAAIDYGFIREEILKLSKQFRIVDIAFDRWGATQIAQELDGEGITVVPLGQGFRDMTAPTKETMRMVLAKEINHGGHPVLRWNAENLMVREDPAGNLKPDKEKSKERIDGVVALIMAVDRETRNRMAGPMVSFLGG